MEKIIISQTLGSFLSWWYLDNIRGEPHVCIYRVSVVGLVLETLCALFVCLFVCLLEPCSLLSVTLPSSKPRMVCFKKKKKKLLSVNLQKQFWSNNV